jgi:hypothetical protein
MSLSTIILLIWVFLVSIAVRGWSVGHLSSLVFWFGSAYIVVFLLEFFGFITLNIPLKKR